MASWTCSALPSLANYPTTDRPVFAQVYALVANGQIHSMSPSVTVPAISAKYGSTTANTQPMFRMNPQHWQEMAQR